MLNMLLHPTGFHVWTFHSLSQLMMMMLTVGIYMIHCSGIRSENFAKNFLVFTFIFLNQPPYGDFLFYYLFIYFFVCGVCKSMRLLPVLIWHVTQIICFFCKQLANKASTSKYFWALNEQKIVDTDRLIQNIPDILISVNQFSFGHCFLD